MLAEEILEKLHLVPLEKLKIHEQTIDENIRSLRERMLNLGRIVDPIIVEGKNHVVLDGNHRREVLASMKLENAICQVVDYEDKGIRVEGWNLAIMCNNPMQEFGFKAEEVDYSAGLDALRNMEAAFLIGKEESGGKKFYLANSHGKSLGEMLLAQKEIVSKLPNGNGNGNGGKLMYIEDIRSNLFMDKGYWVFHRRRYTKKEIISEASEGRPLPPKSTRHIIPSRIVRLNYHLSYLDEPVEKARRKLIEMIRKRVRYGSARYYTEPVIVLY